MQGRNWVFFLLLVPAVICAPTLQLYSTFHSIGVTVNLAASDDTDSSATTNVTYRAVGTSTYRNGHPLTRVSSTRFSGSIFFAEPNTAYEVRVSFTDNGALNGQVVTAEITTRSEAELVAPAPSKTYYVSPTGTGTTCTSSAPCALSTAISSVNQGEEIVLRGGVYYVGGMTLSRSGAAGRPIVIRGADGEEAILDGASPDSFTWTLTTNGVYTTTIPSSLSATHLVIANGKRLYPYACVTGFNGSATGLPGFYVSGTTLSVKLSGSANPNNAQMIISRYEYCFWTSSGRQYVHIKNLTFRHYGHGEYPKAIYLDGASNFLISNCTFYHNDLSIGLKRESNGNVIQYNEFYDTKYMWQWEAVKDEGYLEAGAISIYSSTTDGRGTIVRYNTFHDFFDCMSSGGSPTVGGNTNEIDVYDNYFYNCGDDGISADGTCANCRIWGNTIRDTLSPISLAPIYIGPIYCINNLMYNLGGGYSTAGYRGVSFKFNVGGEGQSGRMYLYHNTVDARSTQHAPTNNGIQIGNPGTWQMIISRNNIWAGTNYAIYYDTNQPIDFDYDVLYTSVAGELAYWSNLADRHLNTLQELQDRTGQEMHGKNFAPQWTNANAYDYSLPTNSNLRGVGVYIPGVNDGYSSIPAGILTAIPPSTSTSSTTTTSTSSTSSTSTRSTTSTSSTTSSSTSSSATTSSTSSTSGRTTTSTSSTSSRTTTSTTRTGTSTRSTTSTSSGQSTSSTSSGSTAQVTGTGAGTGTDAETTGGSTTSVEITGDPSELISAAEGFTFFNLLCIASIAAVLQV